MSNTPSIVPIAKRLEALEAQEHEIERQIEQELEQRQKKRGPEPTPMRGGVEAVFIADTVEERDRLTRAYIEAVGPKTRGNRRLGRMRLYADLVSCFAELQRRGIKLPRNKSLSAAACVTFCGLGPGDGNGLGDVLRAHNLTTASDEMLRANGRARQKISNALDRVFSRVADALERNTPAKIRG